MLFPTREFNSPHVQLRPRRPASIDRTARLERRRPRSAGNAGVPSADATSSRATLTPRSRARAVIPPPAVAFTLTFTRMRAPRPRPPATRSPAQPPSP